MRLPRGCSDAGNDFVVYPILSEHINLLSATAEHEGVSPFEPHNRFPLQGMAGNLLVDCVLFEVVAVFAFAGIDFQATELVDDCACHQIVIENDIGILQRPHSLQGKEFRVAGAGSGYKDISFFRCIALFFHGVLL